MTTDPLLTLDARTREAAGRAVELSPDVLDVIVVGAGQAGLAIAWHLSRHGIRFVLVDGAPALGHSWRTRWDSLRLFSPAQYDALPGMAFPAPRDTYPTKDEVADYLARYARTFELPVLLGHRVDRLSRRDGLFTVHTSRGTLTARQVVVATGAFGRPRVPGLAAALDDEVVQVHSAQYRNADQLPPGPVLVVGAGNSGLQIAEELATPGDGAGEARRHPQVHLAVGSSPPQLPLRFAGRDLFWWLTRTGALNRPAHSRLARSLRARGDLVIGTSRASVARRGVTLHPRVTAATASGVEFADGSRLAPRSVVWATGFVPDYRWIEIPGVIAEKPRPGTVLHERGVTSVPGLYFLGLPWQHTRGSALLGFVGEDAGWLADRLGEHRR